MAGLFTVSYTLENIDDAVKQFWPAVSGSKIIAFSGQMGAGKTTFIHHLCGHLGVTDTVTSPTFALINEYHFEDAAGKDQLIYHLDWYRLKDTAEAINAGMEDCIRQAMLGNAWCFIEWPEKAAGLLPSFYSLAAIETVSRELRQLTVSIVNE